jgi:L-gulonolactone oxidase
VTVLRNDSDADLPEIIGTWGHGHEYADVFWLLGQGRVLLRQDDRVDASTPGNGLFDGGFLRLRPTSDFVRERKQEEQL